MPHPALIPSMLAGLNSLKTSDVAELHPIVLASWTLQEESMPGLIAVALVAFRKRRASLTIFIHDCRRGFGRRSIPPIRPGVAS